MSTRPIIVGLIVSLSLVNGAGQETSKALRVVGYYADWTAARYPLAEIPADKLTHVNYAFGKIGPDNRLTLNASAAVEHVYPGDCGEPGCPHGLFNQITLLKTEASAPEVPHVGRRVDRFGTVLRDGGVRGDARRRSRSRAPTS